MNKRDEQTVAAWLDEVALILDSIREFLEKRDQLLAGHLTVEEVDPYAEHRISESARTTSASPACANLQRLAWLLQQLEQLCAGLPKHPLIIEAHAIALQISGAFPSVRLPWKNDQVGAVPTAGTFAPTDEGIRLQIEEAWILAYDRIDFLNAKITAHHRHDLLNYEAERGSDPCESASRSAEPSYANIAVVREAVRHLGRTAASSAIESRLRTQGRGMNRQRMLRSLDVLREEGMYEGARPPRRKSRSGE